MQDIFLKKLKKLNLTLFFSRVCRCIGKIPFWLFKNTVILTKPGRRVMPQEKALFHTTFVASIVLAFASSRQSVKITVFSS
jgi:hypothetical protein